MFITFRKQLWKLLSPPWIDNYVWDKMRIAVASGKWCPADRARTVERLIARALGVDPTWVVATRSATVALEAAYRFFFDDLERIRVSPLTFVSTYSGAVNSRIPIEWVDVDDEGRPVAPVDVAVDLWGRRHSLVPDLGRGTPRLVDAAHRLLAPEHAELVRGGSALVYSFDLRKEVSCLCGGALVSSRVPTTFVREWLHFGLGPNRIPIHGLGGTNGGLPDPIAAQAIEGIKRLPRSRKRRQEVLRVYTEALGKAMLTTHENASGHVAVMRAGSEGEALAIRRKLDLFRVDHSLHYALPPELHAVCPNAAALTKRLVTLPCNQYMRTPSDPLRVARLVVSV